MEGSKMKLNSIQGPQVFGMNYEICGIKNPKISNPKEAVAQAEETALKAVSKIVNYCEERRIPCAPFFYTHHFTIPPLPVGNLTVADNVTVVGHTILTGEDAIAHSKSLVKNSDVVPSSQKLEANEVLDAIDGGHFNVTEGQISQPGKSFLSKTLSSMAILTGPPPSSAEIESIIRCNK